MSKLAAAGPGIRTIARAFTLVALTTVIGSLACSDVTTDPNGKAGPKNARLGLRPSYVVLGADQSLPINFIRITVREQSSGTVLGTVSQPVDPNAAEWDIAVDVSLLTGGSTDAVALIELVNRTGTGVETIEWSGNTPLRIAPGQAQQVANVEIFRGPPGNLTITAVSIRRPVPGLIEGGSLQLAADITGGTNGQMYWSSLDPTIATATIAGLVQALRPGNARVVVVAGPRSDTVSVSVAQRLATLQVTPGNTRMETLSGEVTLQARALDPRGADVSGVLIDWTSSTPGVLEHLGEGRFRALGNGTAAVTAAARSNSSIRATATVLVAQRITNLTITPGTARLNSIGARQQFAVSARDAGGNAVAGAAVQWSSSNSAVVRLDANGLATSVSAGSALIRATAAAVPSQSGTAADTISTTAAVTVAQTVAAITVTPASHSFSALQETASFSATARDSSGAVVPNISFTWSSTNGSVASVNGSGLVTAIGNGGAQIRATDGNVTGSAAVTVQQTVTRVDVTPARDTLRTIGATRQFSALARDRNNNVVSSSFAWSSSDTTIASINASGLATARRAGSVTIMAHSASGSGTATLVVSAAPATSSIALVSGDRQVGGPGATLPNPLTVRVSDGAGAPMAGVTVQFAVTSGGGTITAINATTDAQGLARASWTLGSSTAPQSAEARATGLTGSPVVFTSRPPATITVTPTAAVMRPTDTLTISATARDTLGNPVPPSGISWSSSDTTRAVVTSAGRVTARAAGNAVITASTGQASATSSITVQQRVPAHLNKVSGDFQVGAPGSTLANPLTVQVSDSAGTVVAGVLVQFVVTGGGGSLSPVSVVTDVNGLARSTWTLGSSQTPQSAEARVTGLIGSPVVFSSRPPATITVAPTSATLTPGDTLTLVATARDTLGNVVPPSGITWTSSDTLIATVSSLGRVSARAQGSATITASTGMASTTAVITVQDAVNTVTVTPPSANLASSDTLRLTATARNALGNPVAATFTWVSSDTSVLTVSSTGLLSGRKVGSAVVTASTAGKSGTATIFVMQGPAATLQKVSGDAQVGPVGVALSQPNVVRVTDAFGNRVQGTTVQFVVTSGGGTTAPVTVSTDTAGLARTFWTLGGASTAQTLEARATGLSGSPAVFTANSTTQNGATITWVGGAIGFPTSWNAPANWAPARTPLATDTAFIPAAALNKPALVSAATIGGVIVESGTHIETNGFNLTVTNFLDAGNSVIGSGSVVMSGAGRVKGSISNLNLTGNVTAIGPVTVSGTLTALSAGNLTLGGHTVTAGTLQTNGGTITMTNAADLLNVTGTASFSGANQTNLLTQGEIRIGRNFRIACSNGRDFVANGVRVVMNGAGADTLSMSCGAATLNRIGTLDISKTAGTLTIVGELYAVGNVNITTPISIDGGNITALGNVSSVAGSGLVNAQVSTGGAAGTTLIMGHFSPVITVLTGTNQILKSSLAYRTVSIAGQNAAFDGGVSVNGGLHLSTGGSRLTLGGPTNVTGGSNLVGGDIALNGHRLNIAGDLSTTAGAIQMTNPADTLDVLGRVSFTGGTTTGKLTTGLMRVHSDFLVGCTSGQDFVSTGTRVVMLGTGADTLSMNCPGAGNQRFHHLDVIKPSGSLTLESGGAYLTGNFTIGSATPFSGIGTMFTVLGDFSTAAGSSVTVPNVSIGGGAGTTNVNGAFTPGRVIMTGTNQVLKSTLGYNDILIQGPGASFNGSAALTGGLALNSAGTLALGGTTTVATTVAVNSAGDLILAGRKLTVAGEVRTAGGTITMTNPADTLDAQNRLTFGGADQLTRLTAGLIRVNQSLIVQCASGRDFASTGTRVRFYGAGADSLRMDCPGPGNHQLADVDIAKSGGTLTVSGIGAHVTGSFNLLTPTLVGGPSTLTVLGDLTSVAGSTVNVVTVRVGGPSGTTLINGTFNPANTVMTGANQTIKPLGYINLTVQTGTAASNGGLTVSGNLMVTNSGANLSLAGTTVVTGTTSSYSGANLSLAGGRLSTGGFITSGGTLTMTNPSDTLDVAGQALFSGGAQGTRLSAGLIRLQGGLTALCGSGTDFVSTGTRVMLVGAATDTLRMDCSAANNQRFHHLDIAKSGGSVVFAGSSLHVSGDLRVLSPTLVNGIGTAVLGDLSSVAGSSVGLNSVTLFGPAGTTLVNGSYSAATTAFSGALQVARSGLSYQNVSVLAGVVTINAPLTIAGTLLVSNAGADFRPSGFAVTANTLTTQSGGIIRMVNPSDTLIVLGDATFGGGAQAGRLTAGLLRVRGSFFAGCITGQDFASTGTTLRMDGTAAQNLTVNCAGSGALQNKLFNLELNNPTTVALPAPLVVTGDVSVNAGLFSGGSVAITGNLASSPGTSITVNAVSVCGIQGTTQVNGSFTSALLTMCNTATGSILKPGLGYQSVSIAGNTSLSGPTSIAGNMTVVANGDMHPAGNHLTIGGALTTQSGGRMIMNNGADTVSVAGNAMFGGAAQDSTLFAGVFRFNANLVVNCITARDFAPMGTRVLFNGTSVQTVTMGCPSLTQHRFAAVDIAAGSNVTLGTTVFGTGLWTNAGIMTVLNSHTLDVFGLTLRSTSNTTNNGVVKTNLTNFITESGHVYSGAAVIQR